jgi:hypothetical protein
MRSRLLSGLAALVLAACISPVTPDDADGTDDSTIEAPTGLTATPIYDAELEAPTGLTSTPIYGSVPAEWEMHETVKEVVIPHEYSRLHGQEGQKDKVTFGRNWVSQRDGKDNQVKQVVYFGAASNGPNIAVLRYKVQSGETAIVPDQQIVRAYLVGTADQTCHSSYRNRPDKEWCGPNGNDGVELNVQAHVVTEDIDLETATWNTFHEGGAKYDATPVGGTTIKVPYGMEGKVEIDVTAAVQAAIAAQTDVTFAIVPQNLTKFDGLNQVDTRFNVAPQLVIEYAKR